MSDGETSMKLILKLCTFPDSDQGTPAVDTLPGDEQVSCQLTNFTNLSSTHL